MLWQSCVKTASMLNHGCDQGWFSMLASRLFMTYVMDVSSPFHSVVWLCHAESCPSHAWLFHTGHGCFILCNGCVMLSHGCVILCYGCDMLSRGCAVLESGLCHAWLFQTCCAHWKLRLFWCRILYKRVSCFWDVEALTAVGAIVCHYLHAKLVQFLHVCDVGKNDAAQTKG